MKSKVGSGKWEDGLFRITWSPTLKFCTALHLRMKIIKLNVDRTFLALYQNDASSYHEIMRHIDEGLKVVFI